MATAEDFTAAFPKKHMSAGALFFHHRGVILLVKPAYKDGWEIPGGIVEQDESPKQACAREIKEELGLEVTVGRLLVLDYTSRQGTRSDSLQMVFLGGTLTPATIKAIRLPAAELSECRFVAPEAALLLLQDSLSLRVAGCLRAIAEGRTLMLHDGLEV